VKKWETIWGEGKMRRLLWSSVIVMAAAWALWAFQAETRPSATRSWEYAIVQNWRSNGGSTTPEGNRLRAEYRARVTICYMQESGCRLEEVEIALSFVEDKGNRPNHWDEVYQAAVGKALASLGSAGWELVGSGPDPIDPNNPAAPVRRALYLKRPRQ
jgi:hypothetical protein